MYFLKHFYPAHFTLLLFFFFGYCLYGQNDTTTVLFLGNSHTYVNDVPQLIKNIALSNNDPLVFEKSTPGGCTLGHPSNGHLYNSTSLALIDSVPWDYVILQEHSVFAVIDYYRENYTYPGAFALDSLIKNNNPCTKTLMQVLWGKKFGGQYCINDHCSIVFDDFMHMQDSLTSKYVALSDSLKCEISPVGMAWRLAIENGSPIELFHADESHATLAGSYLSACVHYSTMFRKPSSGLWRPEEIEQEIALFLQSKADAAVFSDTTLWNFGAFGLEVGFDYTQNGQTVDFINYSENADFYIWDFGDGTTDKTQNPQHTYETSGSYLVTLLVGNGCKTAIATDTISISITQNPQNQNTNPGVLLQPSGKKGKYILTTAKIERVHVKVFNLQGELLQSIALPPKDKMEIDLSEYSKGIYFININSSNQSKTYKVNP